MANRVHCPVCSYGVYSDPEAPMARQGSENPTNHRCDDNGTWKQRTRFGGTKGRLRERLLETPEERLAAWPRVLELRRLVEQGNWQ